MSGGAVVFAELLSALNTLLLFARENQVSSRKLLDEYLAAEAEHRTLTGGDILQVKAEARMALAALHVKLDTPGE